MVKIFPLLSYFCVDKSYHKKLTLLTSWLTDPQYFALKKKKFLKQFFQESEDKHAKCNRS